MLPPLFSRADRVILTQPPSAPVERRWDPEAVASSLSLETRPFIETDFARALEAARAAAAGGTVVVTGSCHTVGDALADLGLVPFAR